MTCKYPNCNIQAIFNIPGTTTGIFCKVHATEDMIDVKNVKCVYQSCIKQPHFGNKGEKAKYCKEHALPGMIDVIHKLCLATNCKTRPTFNYKGVKPGIYCKTHALKDMIDVTKKLCLQDGCNKCPNFNYIGKKNGLYCNNHKLANMINVKSKKCVFVGCTTRPSFNTPGNLSGIYCATHALPGMIDVLEKRKCIYTKCNKNAYYNYTGEKHGKYCREHADPKMICLKGERCTYPKCFKRPNYNYPNQNKKLYCKSHKLEGMVDVRHDRCSHVGCDKRPGFNFRNELRAMYCKEHALPNMMDVITDRCSYPNCEIRANYGKLFNRKEHCKKHSNVNEYLQNNPKCLTSGCLEHPLYTDKIDNYPLRCELHKLINDKNVIETPCKNCGLPNFINESTLLCNDCSDFIIKKVHKAKEHRIKEILDSNNIKYESYDRPIDGGCTKYRPDFVIDYGTFKVIVEVDENQHKSYACDCEVARMCMIHQDMGGIPVIFIRFNPDSYKVNEKLVREYKSRERKLLDLLYAFRNVMEVKYPMIVCYMYYDEFDGIIHFHSVDYFNGKSEEVFDIFI